MKKPRHFFYRIFKTRYGYLAVVRTVLGIQTMIIFKNSKSDLLVELNSRYGSLLKKGKAGFKSIIQKLKKYLAGRTIKLNQILDLSWATRFEKKVYQAALKIPRGQSRSYGWVAEKIQLPQAARAVGQALSRNQIPIIIPCHRVLAKGGALGGFTPEVKFKRLLLNLEHLNLGMD